MDFDGAHGDVQVVGDDLVEFAGENEFHDFAFARGQAGEAAGDAGLPGFEFACFRVVAQRFDVDLLQFVVVEGLLHEVLGAL